MEDQAASNQEGNEQPAANAGTTDEQAVKTAPESSESEQPKEQQQSPVHYPSDAGSSAPVAAVSEDVYSVTQDVYKETVVSVVMPSGYELQVTNRMSMGEAIISLLLIVLIAFLALKTLLKLAWGR